MAPAKGTHPHLKCQVRAQRRQLQNRKPLSRTAALEIADDTEHYMERNTHDLLRVQHYLTLLVADLAQELRNRYDRGML